MLKVVKVRLYSNKAQQQLIQKTFGSCRFVYNILLDAKIKAYECGDNASLNILYTAGSVAKAS